jgi:hypothetical protein
MGKPCTICQHPHVQEIDSLLDSGEFKKNIAEMFPGVSVHALSRHGRGLCRVDDLDQEEEKWAARLERTYQQALTDQDVRGQQQVATTALRHVRARKAEKAKVAAAKVEQAEDDGQFQFSIGSLDQMVEILSQTEPDPIDKPKIAEALRRSRELSRPDGMSIFYRMLEDNEFAESISDFCANWQPAKKGNDGPQPVSQTNATN